MAKKKAVKKSAKPVRPTKKKAPKKKGVFNTYAKEAKAKPVSIKKAAKKITDQGDKDLVGNNIFTLLDIPNRKKLPAKGTELSKIYNVIEKRPDDYKYFIAQIKDGVSLNVACAASGICSPQELMTYLRRGAQDINRYEDRVEDTYYARLFNDVNRTAAISIGEVETSIKEDDPKFFLRNSPLARLFGDAWRDDPATTKSIQHTHTGNVSLESVLGSPSEVKQIDSDPDTLALTEEEKHNSLEELAAAGLITLNEDYYIAKRIQAGELLSDEEMEAMEDEVSDGCDGVLQLNSEGMPLRLPSPVEIEGEIIDG
jgi:hypothetical protein